MKLSHIPTIGNLEDLYPETFGGVSYHGNEFIMMSITGLQRPSQQ